MRPSGAPLRGPWPGSRRIRYADGWVRGQDRRRLRSCGGSRQGATADLWASYLDDAGRYPEASFPRTIQAQRAQNPGTITRFFLSMQLFHVDLALRHAQRIRRATQNASEYVGVLDVARLYRAALCASIRACLVPSSPPSG